MNTLILDNYDSFTYNLVEYFYKATNSTVTVRRNDAIKLTEISYFDRIILSPGPGLPSQSGILEPLIQQYAPSKKILGVCLGHQAIAEVFGAKLEQAPEIYHGVSSKISVTAPPTSLLHGLGKVIEVGRYHSWQVQRESIPECLAITCFDENGTVMGLKHKTYNIEGVQFHPESVLTPLGLEMLTNWLKK